MTESKDPGEAPAAPEQRRVEYSLPVYVRGVDGQGSSFEYLTTVDNMTRRGAFVRLDREVRIGDVVALYAPHNLSDKLCDMEVVWTRDSSRGIPGAGAKLLGANEDWMAYLLERSVRVLGNEAPTET